MNEKPADIDPGNDIDREIEKISSLIAVARRHLVEDRMVDLSALEGKVRVLCASIETVPPEDAGRIMESIKAMKVDLELLARELTAQQQKLGGQVQSIDPDLATAFHAKPEKDEG